MATPPHGTISKNRKSVYTKRKSREISSMVWRALVTCMAGMNGLAHGACPEPPFTPCTADDVCSNQLVKVCACGPNSGRQCVSNADCGGSVCRRAWQEYYVDPGGDMSDCSNFRFGWAGADGVDLADPDGDGDMDIVTGWEESGVAYIYSNPCNPPDPKNPTSCTNPGAVYQEWASPYALDPIDVRGGETLNYIEDAAFADFDLDGKPDGVITATEGLNKDVTIHARAHNGQWLGKALPGDSQLWMQVRAADINGDGCADIVAGTKVSIPFCVDDILEDPCDLCDEFNVVCGRYGGLWWWECPKVDGVCQPFGPKFNDPDPKMDLSHWKKRKINRDLEWVMGIELTDMDGDGDIDVLVSDRLMIGWFENKTSPQQGGVLDGWGDPHIIDDMNSIIARGDGTRFSSGEPFRFHAYGDVDGDGLKDIVVAASFSKGTCSGDSCLYCSTSADCPAGQTCEDSGSADAGRFAGYYYRRTSTSGQSWTIWPVFAEGGLPYDIDAEGDAVSKGVAIGDVTGNGHQDLVFSVRGAGHGLYSLSFDPSANPICAPCATPEWKVRPIAPCRTNSKYDNVQLADIDADGRLDVVTSEENFQADRGEAGHSTGLGVVWYRNLGFCGNSRIDSDEECDNGAMNGAPGQCCDTSCRVLTQQVCRASSGPCDAPEHCASGSGACPPDADYPQGTPCFIGVTCSAFPYECNADGACVSVPQGIPCTQSIQCATGVCISDFCAAACTDDGNPCTYDVCNGGVCQHPPKPPATLCGDNGNECTVQQCDGSGGCQTTFLGTQTNCGQTPTQPCDALDFCDGAGNCTENVRSAGSTCRPSAGGQSQGFCDPPEVCDGVHKECPPDLTAQVGAVCADPPPQSCFEDESICFGYCDEYQCNTTHQCVLTGINPGTICYEDGNECSVHNCFDTWCVRSNVQGPCADDGNECTVDVCQGLLCAHFADPNAGDCEDDGNPCTDDVCLNGQCTHVPVPGRPCDGDGNDCTDDVCSEDGHCYPPLPDETPCGDDGSVCTNDFCVAGVCEHPAVPTQIPCASDDNECTDDVCINGTCQHVALVGQPCADDGNECTADFCNEAGLCSHPPVPDEQACADDGNICTRDRCVSGVCIHPPEIAGFICGSQSSSECDAPDSCDGLGACAQNHMADQTACTPDDLDCTIDECRLGLCVHAAELPLPTDKDVEPLCGGHALLPVEDSPNDVIRAFAVFDDGSGPALFAGGTMLHKWDGVNWTQIDTPIAGTIRALEVADLIDFGDTPALFIGGTLVEPLDGPQPLRRWDGKTWTDLGPFNGPVHALKAIGGQLYAGGAFTTVDFTLGNGTPVNGFIVNHVAKIAFLDPPTWEALGAGTNDTVNALAWGLYSSPPFDRLGVGGAFTTAGGLPATGFAYWDLSAPAGGWSAVDALLPPAGGGSPVIHAMAAYAPDDYLRPFIVGGLFRLPDANSPTGFSTNIARLLGNENDWFGLGGAGVTSDGNHAVRSFAHAVDQSGPATFVGGEFGSFNDVVAAQIARFSSATHSLGTCMNGSVKAMVSFDDGSGEALYVGGLFTNSAGEHFVARWRALSGDLDGDGIVSAADFVVNGESALGMLPCLAGPEPWNSVSGLCGCADLTGDGLVSLRDVAALMNLLGVTE